jgi:hypothetical protein
MLPSIPNLLEEQKDVPSLVTVLVHEDHEYQLKYRLQLLRNRLADPTFLESFYIAGGLRTLVQKFVSNPTYTVLKCLKNFESQKWLEFISHVVPVLYNFLIQEKNRSRLTLVVSLCSIVRGGDTVHFGEVLSVNLELVEKVISRVAKSNTPLLSGGFIEYKSVTSFYS